MIFVFTTWLATIFYKAKCTFPHFNHGFLNRDTTNCINGIFILLVFMSHFNPYVKFTVTSDIWYARIIGKVGQLMVTTFLFYSGYGIMESIKSKGTDYIKNIPKKRIFGTLYKYILAVNCFALMAHYHIPLKKLLLSFIAWESIGNSNWYIFAILMCYVFVFISFTVCGTNYRNGCICVFVLSLFYIYIIYKQLKGQHWWYDTFLCYSVGMFVSLYKEKVIELFKHRIKAFSLLMGGIGFYYLSKNIFLQSHIMTKTSIWAYQNVFYIFAVLLIVFISTNVYIKNGILEWFGSHLFSFYILQRLPMNYLKKIGLGKDVYLYFLLSFVSAVILAYFFDKLIAVLDKRIKISN